MRIFGPPRSWRIATSRPARAAAARMRANVARLRLVRAVREVQAEDVGAGRDERVEHRVGVAGRPDGRDDLRVTHHSRSTFAFVVRRSSCGSTDEPRTSAFRIAAMGAIVPDAIEQYLAGLNRGGDAVLDEIAREQRRRAVCRSSTPKSARCCACWRPPSARRASSRSARRSATRASGSPARCRRAACC